MIVRQIGSVACELGRDILVRCFKVDFEQVE